MLNHADFGEENTSTSVDQLWVIHSLVTGHAEICVSCLRDELLVNVAQHVWGSQLAHDM